MSRFIATFRALCASCGRRFEHPSLGSHAYGEIVLCSKDGLVFAWVNAFSEVPKKIKELMPDAVATAFWKAVASQADFNEKHRWTARIHCPACSSDHLEFWEGDRVGTLEVPEATFRNVEALSTSELQRRLASEG